MILTVTLHSCPRPPPYSPDPGPQKVVLLLCADSDENLAPLTLQHPVRLRSRCLHPGCRPDVWDVVRPADRERTAAEMCQFLSQQRRLSTLVHSASGHTGLAPSYPCLSSNPSPFPWLAQLHALGVATLGTQYCTCVTEDCRVLRAGLPHCAETPMRSDSRPVVHLTDLCLHACSDRDATLVPQTTSADAWLLSRSVKLKPFRHLRTPHLAWCVP